MENTSSLVILCMTQSTSLWTAFKECGCATSPVCAVHKMSTTVQRWQVAAVTLTWDMVRNRVNVRTQLRSVFKALIRTIRKPQRRMQGASRSPTPCTSPRNTVEGGAWAEKVEEPDKVRHPQNAPSHSCAKAAVLSNEPLPCHVPCYKAAIRQPLDGNYDCNDPCGQL